MEKSQDESMFGDTKDKTKVQSWEEIMQAICNNLDTNLSEDKLGLVSQREDKTTEQVGEEVYNELLQQGLIEPNDNDLSPLVNKCKMHPLIRYTLISETKKAGFFYFKSKDKTSSEDLENLSSSRLCLIVDLAKDGDVHTVFNVNQQYLSLQHHSLSDMKKLVVLQLGRWQHSPNYHIEVDDQKFLDDLGVHHKHLKFLSLQGISRIATLPDSIVELVSLEILDLQACHNLEKLPEDIASLKKLTHLDVSECYLIERMPKRTEKLSSLQVLKGVVIGTAWRSPCMISDFGKLTKLRRLSIYIGRGATIWDEEFASLKGIASLCSPTISCGKLHIIGGEMISWDHQQYNEQWSVEILRLKHLRRLRIGNNENLLKRFPRLGYFEKINCADNIILWYRSRAV
ncbi:hypothetical protein ACJRO7_004100 [Eucalyptus globulus]|uniref:Disease resistance RPP13-like protein 4 n=1 Tax=Eucalyptus globulus TaxID=34317 RepID=A0ABD3IWC7_EUCGL